MADCQSPETRIAPETSTGINSLIAAANKQDRFKLLEDDSVPAGNLDISIHPILGYFDCDGPMNQMLLLASHFLAHDTILTFFVPLIFGRELTTTDRGLRKTYLSDPLTNASDTRRRELVNSTREALHCLAHSIQFDWMRTDKRVYARTTVSSIKSVHAPSCCTAFQRKVTPKIEMNTRFKVFYTDKNGYLASSRCAQFRHDFLFASTIVHELVHAMGVMRRGHTYEEWICADHPSTEWGYAWEHFMFGCIINPQNRDQPGTSLLMKKAWADGKIAEDAGGKEYSNVSMPYIAQWFRQETWDIVAEQGPIAIPPPTTNFKIQSAHRYGAWIVSTDSVNIKQDIVALQLQWKQQRRKLEACGIPQTTSIKIFWRSQSKEALQRHNVATPSRIPRKAQQYPAYGKKPHVSKVTCTTGSKTVKRSAVTKTAPPPHAPQSNALGVSRKRPAEATDSGRAGKVTKR